MNKCTVDKPSAVDSIKHEHFFNSHELPSDIKTNIRCSVIDEVKSVLTRTEHISKQNTLPIALAVSFLNSAL